MTSRLMLQSSAGSTQTLLRVQFCEHLAVWRPYEGREG